MHGTFLCFCEVCISLHLLLFCFRDLSGSFFNIRCIWVLSKSHIERGVAEKAQTRKRTLDPSDPAGVLDWEVVEAEGIVTEKQTKSSLSAKEEESSGLVNVIAGVFHKG